ncbi:sugar phosphate isomerase/epimerase family protein [Metabacillus sp. SLBN-84]
MMKNKIGMRIPPHFTAEGLEYTAKWAKENGIGVLDLPYLDQDVQTILSDFGLEAGSIDGRGAVGGTALLSEDEEKRAQAVLALKNQFQEISSLGGKVVFMCLVPENSLQPVSRSLEIWKQTFPEVVKHAEKNDLYITLEGWPGPAPLFPTLGATPEVLRYMFKEVPSNHFGINYDPSHLVRLGIDPLKFLEEFGSKVLYCHGKDTLLLQQQQYAAGHLPSVFGAKYDFSEGPWRYTIPGEGEVDWKKTAAKLEQLGYAGPVSIELEDHNYWGSLAKEQEGIKKAKDYLETVFQKEKTEGIANVNH